MLNQKINVNVANKLSGCHIVTGGICHKYLLSNAKKTMSILLTLILSNSYPAFGSMQYDIKYPDLLLSITLYNTLSKGAVCILFYKKLHNLQL